MRVICIRVLIVLVSNRDSCTCTSMGLNWGDNGGDGSAVNGKNEWISNSDFASELEYDSRSRV